MNDLYYLQHVMTINQMREEVHGDNAAPGSITAVEAKSEPTYTSPAEDFEINPASLPEPDVEQAVSEVPLPEAPELLGRAARHMHDRAATYDTLGGERSMGKAVRAFNAITGRELTEAEGWLLLQVLKDVRLFTRVNYHGDSAEDCIAYAALKAEAKSKGL